MLLTTGMELATMPSIKTYIGVVLLGALLITLVNFFAHHLHPPDALYLSEPLYPSTVHTPVYPSADPRLYAMGLNNSYYLNGTLAFSTNAHTDVSGEETIPFDMNLPVDRSHFLRATTIIYNRVPKCGGTTAYTIMQTLGARNHFICKLVPELHISYLYENEEEEEKRFTTEFKKARKKKALFHGHMYFKDISRYANLQNRSSPFYINLVREPLDRMQSFYYFIRYQKGHVREMSQEKLQMSFSECVRRLDPECTHSQNYMTQVSFFCGPMAFCRLPGMGALQQAKRNVVEHYTIVGTMARLRDFFIALEWTFPSWFKDAARIYDYQQRKNVSVHNKLAKIPYSRTLDPDVHFIMTTLLKEDYDFYHFIQQRFDAYMKYITAKNRKH